MRFLQGFRVKGSLDGPANPGYHIRGLLDASPTDRCMNCARRGLRKAWVMYDDDRAPVQVLFEDDGIEEGMYHPHACRFLIDHVNRVFGEGGEI